MNVIGIIYLALILLLALTLMELRSDAGSTTAASADEAPYPSNAPRHE